MALSAGVLKKEVPELQRWRKLALNAGAEVNNGGQWEGAEVNWETVGRVGRKIGGFGGGPGE